MIEQLTVGFIRGAHGVTGDFKVESASGSYDHIAALKEVTLRHGSERKFCKIEWAESGSGTLYMKIAGIDSPEAVQMYTGWELVVPREYAAPLGKGEWYIEDLKQCSLIYENRNGLAEEAAPAEKVGTITDVLEGGADYLFEVLLSESCTVLAENIKRTASGKPRTVLVPFNRTFIGSVDIENKTVQLMHLWILE